MPRRHAGGGGRAVLVSCPCGRECRERAAVASVRVAGQAADASCAAPVLAVLIHALTAGRRAANPEVEIYVGLVAGGFVIVGLLLGLAGALAGLRVRRRRLVAPALVGLLLNGALATWDVVRNADRRVLLDGVRPRVYRVREPADGVSGPIVVYLRGAGVRPQ